MVQREQGISCQPFKEGSHLRNGAQCFMCVILQESICITVLDMAGVDDVITGLFQLLLACFVPPIQSSCITLRNNWFGLLWDHSYSHTLYVLPLPGMPHTRPLPGMPHTNSCQSEREKKSTFHWIRLARTFLHLNIRGQVHISTTLPYAPPVKTRARCIALLSAEPSVSFDYQQVRLWLAYVALTDEQQATVPTARTYICHKFLVLSCTGAWVLDVPLIHHPRFIFSGNTCTQTLKCLHL